jgi:hypothetical protein
MNLSKSNKNVLRKSILPLLVRRVNALREKLSFNPPAEGFKEMGSLRCDGCGEEFLIFHRPAFVNEWLVDQQARWLETVLAEEKERDKKHPDRIKLPD